MQKLPEAQQEKEPRMRKEGTSGVKIPKSFLILVEATMRSSLDDPRLKISTNGLVRITIKTPYNRLND